MSKDIAKRAAESEASLQVKSEICSQFVVAQIAIAKKHTADPKDMQALVESETQKHDNLLQSLGANDPLMAMLATQMATIHDLQQHHYLVARRISSSEQAQYHTNIAAKLSNVFVQQATLLHKLQGRGQQKVVVEHVHVNNGGQAIVGNIGGVGSGRKS